eukprot:195425-Chlamydomonas_euryale.AAC.1
MSLAHKTALAKLPDVVEWLLSALGAPDRVTQQQDTRLAVTGVRGGGGGGGGSDGGGSDGGGGGGGGGGFVGSRSDAPGASDSGGGGASDADPPKFLVFAHHM